MIGASGKRAEPLWHEICISWQFQGAKSGVDRCCIYASLGGYSQHLSRCPPYSASFARSSRTLGPLITSRSHCYLPWEFGASSFEFGVFFRGITASPAVVATVGRFSSSRTSGVSELGWPRTRLSQPKRRLRCVTLQGLILWSLNLSWYAKRQQKNQGQVPTTHPSPVREWCRCPQHRFRRRRRTARSAGIRT